MLEQLPLRPVSTVLALESEVRRLGCWRGRDVLFWTLRGQLLATDLVRPCSSEPQVRSWEKGLLVGPAATGPGPKIDLEDQYEGQRVPCVSGKVLRGDLGDAWSDE